MLTLGQSNSALKTLFYFLVAPRNTKNFQVEQQQIYTLESRIIGGVGIIGGLDIVIIVNNRGELE